VQIKILIGLERPIIFCLVLQRDFRRTYLQPKAFNFIYSILRDPVIIYSRMSANRTWEESHHLPHVYDLLYAKERKLDSQ